MEAATPVSGDLLEGGELSLRLLSGAPRGLPAEANAVSSKRKLQHRLMGWDLPS